jgi:hypothetical protein
MSALGQKQTFRAAIGTSALPPESESRQFEMSAKAPQADIAPTYSITSSSAIDGTESVRECLL